MFATGVYFGVGAGKGTAFRVLVSVAGPGCGEGKANRLQPFLTEVMGMVSSWERSALETV